MLQNPGELDVIEHAVLDGRLLVHVFHLAARGNVSSRGQATPGHKVRNCRATGGGGAGRGNELLMTRD